VSAIEIRLTLPVELGAAVVASDAVQAALAEMPEVRSGSVAVDARMPDTFHDAGATAVIILGAPAVIAGVKGVFDVIRTAIVEAHKTRRTEAGYRHELRKLLLTAGSKRLEIDLDEELPQIESRVAEIEAATLETR
jgi:hypothetical protein